MCVYIGMENDNELVPNEGTIPNDDISLFYGPAPEPVKRAISMLLQEHGRFYVYTSDVDRNDNRAACVMDEKSYGDVVYHVLFDFVQRYGHLAFFNLFMGFLEDNTHIVTASMLYTMLGEKLAHPGASESPSAGDDV